MTEQLTERQLLEVLPGYVPTKKQERLLRIVRRNGFPESWADLARMIGCHVSVIDRWRQNVPFWTWLNDNLSKDFQQQSIFIKNKLVEKALNGSAEHMKIFFQMTGELSKTEKVAIDVENLFVTEIRNANSISVSRGFNELP